MKYKARAGPQWQIAPGGLWDEQLAVNEDAKLVIVPVSFTEKLEVLRAYTLAMVQNADEQLAKAQVRLGKESKQGGLK